MINKEIEKYKKKTRDRLTKLKIKFSLTKPPVFNTGYEKDVCMCVCVCVWGREWICNACVYLPCEVFARSEVKATSDLADLKFRK